MVVRGSARGRGGGHGRAVAAAVGILLLVAAVLAALTFLYRAPAPQGGRGTGAPPELAVGAPAPALELRTLDGGRLTLAELRGAPVWLSFWATECAPCVEQLPDLLTVGREAEARGVRVVAVSAGEGRERVRSYLEHTGYADALQVALDPEYVAVSAYRVSYMPTHVFLGVDGRVVRVERGPMDAGAMRDAVAELR